MAGASLSLRTLAAAVALVFCGCKRTGSIAPTAAATPSHARSTSGFDDPLPGAPPLPAEVATKIEAAWRSRAANYQPRTRHLRSDGQPRYTNRLFLETSPYLRQHAHNPVNWYPWGAEAFAEARRLGRPVLLSIGYSTCHWCHVMEEESFEDEEVARYLNENYVAIKVDREERPDLDTVYMAAVQALTGRGGWPMTVWLTPDRRPFYAGTYFPVRDGDRGGGVGFLSLLRRLRASYDAEPERIAATATQLVGAIERELKPGAGGGLPSADIFDGATAEYRPRFDSTYGGVGTAPKFPSSLPVRLLLRHYLRTGNRDSLRMATLTLEKMAAGGMYDQVGGGFHRYSTDREWLVPHFEKMLYDNARLALAYLDGYQATGRPDFARVVREILRYVERDMTSPEGAFYSATDADSLTPSGRREEGWFFTWTPSEIDAAGLRPEQRRLVSGLYGVAAGGNFEGRNILHSARPLGEVARELGLPEERARALLDESREMLYRARSRRLQPLRDEKILAAWNGLMISAYAQAALVLDEADYARRAERAADFVLGHMREGERLQRSYKDGRATHDGFLEDYAFVIAGLLDLYEATGTLRWLKESIRLDAVLERHFEDLKGGGFFRTSDDHEQILAREKPGEDGPEPSGNSVHALNLLRLSALTGNDRYRQRAERTLGAFQELRAAPTAFSELLIALGFLLDDSKEIVLVSPTSFTEAEPFLSKLRATFHPNHVLVQVTAPEVPVVAVVVGIAAGKTARGGKATAYVCTRGACGLPTTDPDVFAAQLRKTIRATRVPP